MCSAGPAATSPCGFPVQPAALWGLPLSVVPGPGSPSVAVGCGLPVVGFKSWSMGGGRGIACADCIPFPIPVPITLLLQWLSEVEL